MTEDGVLLYTKKGYEEEQERLAYLKGQKRDEIIHRIEVARGFGDLSENAEYTEARNEQRENEAEIRRLEEKLANAKIDDDLGNFVSLLCLWNNKTIEYQIVGSAEANPLEGKISNVAPMGKAIIGKGVGDTVEVNAPSGVKKYKILNIRKPD